MYVNMDNDNLYSQVSPVEQSKLKSQNKTCLSLCLTHFDEIQITPKHIL